MTHGHFLIVVYLCCVENLWTLWTQCNQLICPHTRQEGSDF